VHIRLPGTGSHGAALTYSAGLRTNPCQLIWIIFTTDEVHLLRIANGAMEQAMKQTLITLALGLGFLSLLVAPSAHAQRYLVNGHPATAGEEQILASNGFDAGAWRMDGWGISLDAEHANFVPHPPAADADYWRRVPR
jgi:hypothetical protein